MRLAFVCGIVLLLVAPAVTAEHLGPQDKDCRDFRTWAEAQRFFEGAGSGDPHHLDNDGDGIACETLPGGPGDTNPRPTTGTPRPTAVPRPSGDRPTATPVRVPASPTLAQSRGGGSTQPSPTAVPSPSLTESAADPATETPPQGEGSSGSPPNAQVVSTPIVEEPVEPQNVDTPTDPAETPD